MTGPDREHEDLVREVEAKAREFHDLMASFERRDAAHVLAGPPRRFESTSGEAQQ